MQVNPRDQTAIYRRNFPAGYYSENRFENTRFEDLSVPERTQERQQQPQALPPPRQQQQQDQHQAAGNPRVAVNGLNANIVERHEQQQ